MRPEQCELAPYGGRPPPLCPPYFVGVYASARTNQTEAAGLDETYGVVCVLTYRVGAVPYDRLGADILVKVSTGFDALADLVRLSLAKDLTTGVVLSAANTIIGFDPNDETTPAGFATCLRWLGDDDPQPVDGRWFSARPEAKECGVVQRLRFGGMRRPQDFFGDRPVT